MSLTIYIVTYFISTFILIQFFAERLSSNAQAAGGLAFVAATSIDYLQNASFSHRIQGELV